MSEQKREPTMAAMYPHKIDVSQFAELMKRDADAFAANMIHLKAEDRFAEEWFAMLGAWMEFCNEVKQE
jgi:hypothetical protein